MNRKIMVHGIYQYKCESCGAIEQMYLEVGVEGKNSKQPCPYTINCPECGKFMSHTYWGMDKFFEPIQLKESDSYFKYSKKHGHGIPKFASNRK